MESKPRAPETNDEVSHSNMLACLEAHILPMLRGDAPESLEAWHDINRLAQRALAEAGVSWFKRKILWWYLGRIMKAGARKQDSLTEIEQRLREFFRERVKSQEERLSSQSRRARHYYEVIAPYLVGDRVLDLGAGDGLVAKLIHNESDKDVALIDIIDFNATSLPLIVYDPNAGLPVADNSIDSTVICVVLHHSEDPTRLLAEAARVTRRRIIVVEGDISSPRKLLVNCFFNWFLNRVALDQDMNVPMNFRTEAEWKALFRKFQLRLVEKVGLGIDEPLAPEFHVMYVLDVVASGRSG